MKRKILFLDFDGVLHSDMCVAYFTKLGLFENYLARMQNLEVVVSSAWREVYSLEQLPKLFNSLLSEKIVGITPITENGYMPGGRQREIELYLNANNLDVNNACWVALDDIREFFDPDCQFLIYVDSVYGFGDEHGDALLTWYLVNS